MKGCSITVRNRIPKDKGLVPQPEHVRGRGEDRHGVWEGGQKASQLCSSLTGIRAMGRGQLWNCGLLQGWLGKPLMPGQQKTPSWLSHCTSLTGRVQTLEDTGPRKAAFAFSHPATQNIPVPLPHQENVAGNQENKGCSVHQNHCLRPGTSGQDAGASLKETLILSLILRSGPGIHHLFRERGLESLASLKTLFKPSLLN